MAYKVNTNNVEIGINSTFNTYTSIIDYLNSININIDENLEFDLNDILTTYCATTNNGLQNNLNNFQSPEGTNIFNCFLQNNGVETQEIFIKLKGFNYNNDFISVSLPGHRPHFNNLFCTIKPEDGACQITRTPTELKIGTHTFYPSNFGDGKIPAKVIVVLQGAGGGGAASGSTGGSGPGGGGGALIVGILDLIKLCNQGGVFAKAGAGGAGGASSSKSGEKGGDSFIYHSNKENEKVISVNGGNGGDAASKNGGTGATSNSATINTTYALKLASIGGCGGGDGAADMFGNNGKNGSSYTHTTDIKCTSRPDDFKNYTLTDHNGGSTHNNYGGGGGASPMGNGGDAGISGLPGMGGNNGASGEYGNPGGIGAGGGGGPYYITTITKGGKGGDGIIYFYY